MLEVNPRASRTVPFVSKATGRPLAKIAARVHGRAERSPSTMRHGRASCRRTSRSRKRCSRSCKFPKSDTILGPEMKSTGEVMGTGRTFGEAYAKSPGGERHPAADPRRCLVSVRGPRQGGRDCDREAPVRTWASRSSRPRGPRRRSRLRALPAGRAQGARGPAAHRRHDQERRDRPHHQYDRGQAAPSANRIRSVARRSCAR